MPCPDCGTRYRNRPSKTAPANCVADAFTVAVSNVLQVLRAHLEHDGVAVTTEEMLGALDAVFMLSGVEGQRTMIAALSEAEAKALLAVTSAQLACKGATWIIPDGAERVSEHWDDDLGSILRYSDNPPEFIID